MLLVGSRAIRVSFIVCLYIFPPCHPGKITCILFFVLGVLVRVFSLGMKNLLLSAGVTLAALAIAVNGKRVYVPALNASAEAS